MFITLEGIEGSGKTTQIQHLVAFVNEMGYECLVTREPGGTEIGRQIRAVLLDPMNKGMSPLAELLLYAADRAQHLYNKVLPALSEGKTVICDRFFDATTVYQGFARGLDMELIAQLHQIVLQGTRPDLTLLFDLPAEMGLARARGAIENGSRTFGESRFEQEAVSFHEKVRKGYLTLAEKEPNRFRIIDASRNEADVARQIIRVLTPCFRNSEQCGDVDV